MEIEKIEEIIGYKFNDTSRLKRALTRSAYSKEQKDKRIECEDQSVYRTLGDAVLKSILVDLLINSGCTTRHEITEKKKNIENKKTLSIIARNMGIGTRIEILTNNGEIKQNAIDQPNVLAETLEALIAAIYIDGDYCITKNIVIAWLKNYLPSEFRAYINY